MLIYYKKRFLLYKRVGKQIRFLYDMDFQELILSLRTQTINPELILLVSLLLTVFLDLVFEKSDSEFGNLYQWIPFVGLLASFIAILFQWNDALHPINPNFFKE